MRQGTLLLIFTMLAGAQAPPKNLQVLPKDTSSPDVIAMMRGFSFALNVRCEFCHDTKDFASDEKEAKRTARVMLRMTQMINHDYVSKVAKTPAAPVECFTCHHGISRPRTLQSVLSEDLEKHDIASAVALYRKLRKDYDVSGQYDLGETSLNILTESLLHQNKNKEAVAITELNLDVNSPLSAWSESLIAMAHTANGENEKAKADFKKILARNPQDAWAKKQLETLEKKP